MESRTPKEEVCREVEYKTKRGGGMRYDLEEIKAKINIVELCGKIGHDCPSKTDFYMLCPSHNERTPSFHVYKNATRFYCFGCGISGDVIDFYKLVTGEIDNKKAIEDVAGLASVGAVSESRLLPPAGSGIKRPEPERELLDDSRSIYDAHDYAISYPPILDESYKRFINEKDISARTIETLLDDRSLKFDSKGKMIYVYPKGMKIRTDYESSRGDRWLVGKAAGNIWRSERCDDPNMINIYITEGESDLMRLLTYKAEDPWRAFIAFPGASTRLREMEAYRIGADRNVILLFDNDEAGRECTKEAAAAFKAEGAHDVFTLDWDRIKLENIAKTFKDLGDVPEKVMKNIDEYLINI